MWLVAGRRRSAPERGTSLRLADEKANITYNSFGRPSLATFWLRHRAPTRRHAKSTYPTTAELYVLDNRQKQRFFFSCGALRGRLRRAAPTPHTSTCDAPPTLRARPNPSASLPSAGEAAARLEKRRQSMSTSARSRIDAALRELVLIDGHVTRPGIWLLRFT
jgi:hypothetical protein